MNLSETLAYLRNKVDSINTTLSEDKGHLDHPEDLVFLSGVNGANRAMQSIADTVANPEKFFNKSL